MKNNLSAALALAERGWLIFPLHSPQGDSCDCRKADCPSPAKHPRTQHGLKDATTAAETIERWWGMWPAANIGLATGKESGIVVIDVDPRHGGDVQVQALVQQHGLFPLGPAVETGGGGWHYYFRYPEGFRVPSRNGVISPGIDVKADGGYVVAPPSVHITGVSYESLKGWELEPPELPSWLLQMAIAKQDRRYESSDESAEVPSDVAPGARNSTLAAWGGRLRHYGAPQSVIFAALSAINAEWTQPLDTAEVAQIAASVARYEPEAAIPVVGSASSKPNPYQPEPFTAASLEHEEIPPLRWAVPGLIAEGLGVMAGRAKLGKSFAMLGVSVAVAEGGIALGEISVEDGDVLYLALEDNKRRLQKRLKAMIPEGDKWPDRLFIETKWPRSADGGLEALKAFIGQHPRLRLIVIDTIARFRTMPQGKGRANAYQEDYEFSAEVQRLALDNAIAIVVVTHLNKTLHDDYIDKISGSVGLPGAADTIMYLDRQRGGAGQRDARLRLTGRDIDEQDYKLAFDGATGRWAIMGEWEGEQKSSERSDLLAVMEKIGSPVTPEDIAAALGKTRPTAYKLLYRAALDGAVISHKGKLFTLADIGGDASSLSSMSAVRLSENETAESPSSASLLSSVRHVREHPTDLTNSPDATPPNTDIRTPMTEDNADNALRSSFTNNGKQSTNSRNDVEQWAARRQFTLTPEEPCGVCGQVNWAPRAAGGFVCAECKPWLKVVGADDG